MSKTLNAQHQEPLPETPKYDMSLLADCFQEGEHGPGDMAAHIRAVNVALGQALAVLHNNGIEFKVYPLAIVGFETIERIAVYIDQLELFPLEGGQS